MVSNWIDIIQNYLLPPTCILCGSPGFNSRDICHSCYRHLPGNNQCCYQCAEVLEIPSAIPILCGRCLSLRPAFDETFAPFIHQGAIRYLITSLKFNADYKNARLLGMLLAERLDKRAKRPDCILPVPLHKARYRQRGFNQAIEIARTVSRELQIPLDLVSCHRHRNTPHQTALSAKKRRKNLKNAFSIIKPLYAQHIAILDDVMTTGSTVHELAAVLKNAGVGKVDVWVCARA
ncbi:ComF family protein [Candidatus Methylobacter favarea]|uniref:ComF family protein n=1 Tax=Candidatus Methylobacter favarea TaxID=2707345 RepID=A0A8S0XFJ1_9GAMM|nr:ComF family protein [Candidatus Methylobacter favarea]